MLLAVVLGLLAIAGTAFLMTRRPGATPVATAGAGAGVTEVAVAAEPTPVPETRYIANRDIPPRTLITSDMLRRAAISGAIPPGAITSLDDVRGMMTGKLIRSGDTVMRDAFSKPLDRATLANFTIPSGFRAVAVYVDPAQTAAGLVDVGDRVDVVATKKLTLLADKPDERVLGAKELVAGRTVATNLLVLAVDASLNAPVVKPTPAPGAPGATPAPGAAPGAAPPADAAPPPAGAAPAPAASGAPAETRADSAAPAAGAKIRVLLAAPLETASRLVAANEDGTLHLLVRNPLDGDAEKAPETREYPGRVIIDRSLIAKSPEVTTLSGGSESFGGGSNSKASPSFPVPDLPPVTVSQNTDSAPPMPMPVPPGAPSSDGGGMAPATAPAAPAVRDVMVVRGTEKTRVIVPKR